MAIGEPYATVTELKARLDIADSVDDTRLTQALNAASYGVDRYCGRTFSQADSGSARVYPGAADRRLVSTDDHHTAAPTVETDDDGDGAFETAWSAADFQLEPINGVVGGRSGWPFTRLVAVGSRRFPAGPAARVRVTATWGWVAVPAPVKEATLIVAEEVFKLADAPFGVAGFGEFGAMRVRMNSAAVTMLEPFRRLPVKVA